MPLCAKARHGDLRAPSATNSAMKGPCRFQFVARSFGSIGPPASACLELRAKSEGGGSFLSLQGASRRGSCCAAVGVLGDELACSLQRLNIGIGADAQKAGEQRLHLNGQRSRSARDGRRGAPRVPGRHPAGHPYPVQPGAADRLRYHALQSGLIEEYHLHVSRSCSAGASKASAATGVEHIDR